MKQLIALLFLFIFSFTQSGIATSVRLFENALLSKNSFQEIGVHCKCPEKNDCAADPTNGHFCGGNCCNDTVLRFLTVEFLTKGTNSYWKTYKSFKALRNNHTVVIAHHLPIFASYQIDRELLVSTHPVHIYLFNCAFLI